MLFRLVLASLSCVAVVGCINQTKQELNQQFTNVKLFNSIQLPADALTTRKRKQWNSGIGQLEPNLTVENSQSIPVEPYFPRESALENRGSINENKVSRTNPPQPVKQSSYMSLTTAGRTNALGNPLYELRLYANGQFIGAYATVTGRAHTQNKNRQVAGTEAPLPDGKYTVARAPIPGTLPEAGDLFLPIQPLFRTGRSALGIHYDPSFEKGNGEDGTSGCIALTNKVELDQVLNYVRTYQPEYLEVNIQ